MNPKRTLSFLALALLPAGTARADVSLFVETGAGQGNVEVIDETGTLAPSRPLELQGIRLLPLDFVGRTTLEELGTDRPRRRVDVPGAARVELPFGSGSLFRYVREEATRSVYGYFWVDPGGRARSLWERSGSGALSNEDPIPGRIALDPSGTAFAFVTTPAAGGDLFELDLATRLVTERTQIHAPLDYRTAGLALTPGFGIALTTTGVLRFDRANPDDAAFVAFPGGLPDFIGADVVTSADGSTAAFLAGSGPGALHVYSLRSSGDPAQLTSTEDALIGAGFLPDAPAGPTLALSTDGTQVAWQALRATSTECFVCEVAPVPPPPFQVTSNLVFTDTLNDSGVFSYFSPEELLVVVGEEDTQAVGHVENADVFCVENTGGGSTVLNTSLTSGTAQPPFLAPGELETSAGVRRIPGTTDLLIHDEQSGGTGRLLRLGMAAGLGTLVPDVKAVQSLATAGPQLFLSLARRLANDPTELWCVPTSPAQPATLLASLEEDTQVLRSAARPDGTVAAIARLGTDEFLGRIALPGGSGELFRPFPLTFGPALGFAPDGSMVTTVVLANGNNYFVAWAADGSVRLLTPGARPGFVLVGS